MNRKNIYLSTIAPDAAEAAREYGFGLEIAEYCTAWNMDERFESTHRSVSAKLQGAPRCLLHAPFNELFPCAIDPKARELAAARYRQALELARSYGASNVIIHSGYYERMYYPPWFIGESIRFWRDFMASAPADIAICIENVFEQTPDMLRDIVAAVDHPRLRLCIDIGHVNAYSPVPLKDWIDTCAPYIGHFHVHNNDGSADTHSAVDCGSIDMAAFFGQIGRLCPNATCTLEVREAASSCRYLQNLLTD